MKNAIKKAIKQAVGRDGVDFDVAVSQREEFGHYSTNVAFQLAKKIGKPPIDIAEKIASDIRGRGLDGFEKIKTAPPGFVNFWLSPNLLRAELKEILKNPDTRRGRGSDRKRRRKRIQVEFVSANPTGPLTLANGRGGFLGDVLSNVLEFAGNKVEREYYINDTGNQIITLGKSLIAALGLNLGQATDEENLYKGDYVREWARKHKSLVKKHQNNPLKLGQLAAGDFLKDIKKTLKAAGVGFDRWTSEDKDIHRKSFVSKTLKIFRDKKLAYEKDGATWLKTTEFGDDKDRVLITSDDFPTYFLADSGHYLETKTRGFDRKINILGPDHFGYVKRIQAAAQIVGLKNSEVIVTQTLRLVEKEKEVKMSKRQGEFITFQDLIDEVGADAARFFFLMVSPNTHMDFDLTLAKERSVKNPVYYVQYAYVRAVNIIKKSRTPNLTRFNLVRLDLLNTADDLNLIRKLTQFPEMIEDTARDYQVQRLTRYATDLARAFHNFYEKERIIPDLTAARLREAEVRYSAAKARLALVRASTIIIKNLLNILGISAPEKM